MTTRTRPAAAQALITTTAITEIQPSNALTDLRERLKIEHAAVNGAMNESLIHAMAAGDILIEAKAQLKHGQWLPWLKMSGVSERTAQRYVRLARCRADIEAKSDTMSDLGVSGALAMLAVRRDVDDPVARLSVGLADHTADSSFDFYADITARESEVKASEKLLAEAEAAIVKTISLVKDRPALPESLESESKQFSERICAACREYIAAAAAEMGLTEAELDWFCSAINDLKAQGVDYEERTRALVPEFIRIAREPRPGPSSFVVVSKVRDIASEWLCCVEQRVAQIVTDNER
jgi:hypothetical protein